MMMMMMMKIWTELHWQFGQFLSAFDVTNNHGTSTRSTYLFSNVIYFRVQLYEV